MSRVFFYLHTKVSITQILKHRAFRFGSWAQVPKQLLKTDIETTVGTGILESSSEMILALPTSYHHSFDIETNQSLILASKNAVSTLNA